MNNSGGDTATRNDGVPVTRTCLRHPALILLALHLSGCSTWQPAPAGIAETLAQRPTEVRLTLAGGEVRSVRWPALRGDSVGTLSESCRTSISGDGVQCEEAWRPVAALGDVEGVHLSHFQLGRTLGLTAGVILAAVALPFLGYALAGPQS